MSRDRDRRWGTHAALSVSRGEEFTPTNRGRNETAPAGHHSPTEQDGKIIATNYPPTIAQEEDHGSASEDESKVDEES